MGRRFRTALQEYEGLPVGIRRSFYLQRQHSAFIPFALSIKTTREQDRAPQREFLFELKPVHQVSASSPSQFDGCHVRRLTVGRHLFPLL